MVWVSICSFGQHSALVGTHGVDLRSLFRRRLLHKITHRKIDVRLFQCVRRIRFTLLGRAVEDSTFDAYR